MSGRVKVIKNIRFRKYVRDVFRQTPILKMFCMFVILWLSFAACVYYFESRLDGSPISTYGEALYWSVAAFTTAGIANVPLSGVSHIIGSVWMILGSMLFFGTIVATVTSYFMRPLQRPAKQIIDTIEFNLEQLDDLSRDELELLKETTDTLIVHMERIKEKNIPKSKA